MLDALVEREQPQLEEGAVDEELDKVKADRRYASTVKDWDEMRGRVEEGLREQAALDAVIAALEKPPEEPPDAAAATAD